MNLPTDEPIGGPNAPHTYEPPEGEPQVTEQRAERGADLVQGMVRRSTFINADTAGGILDNMEQLPTGERARALMTLLRNIVWQADNDGTLTPDEIYSHIQTVGRDHHCA